MKAIALQARLARDLVIPDVAELAANARQAIQDAINGGLQTLHSLAPPHSKEVVASISVEAPKEITITVENGSNEISGYDFSDTELYCTLRIDGDEIDNQVIGTNELLHPFMGAGGSVRAFIYGDAVILPEEFEAVSDNALRILESRTDVVSCLFPTSITKGIGRPEYFIIEPNAANQNPPAPAVIRFDKLPDRSYRMRGKVAMGPARVSFQDLLTSEVSIPLRSDHVEAYLIPVCRAALTNSRFWREPNLKPSVRRSGEKAEADYAALIPKHISTNRNKVRTRPGF